MEIYFNLNSLSSSWIDYLICSLIALFIIPFLYSSPMLSVIGNAAVLVTAVLRPTSLKAAELLTVNLAVTDIGMALTMYPLSIASLFNHIWIGGDSSCLYYGLMGMIFSTASIITLTFQRHTITMIISGIWLYSVLWAVFPLMGWGGYGPEPFGVACSVDWASYQDSLNRSTFIMSLSILCTFIPCLIILFSYSGIAWKLHKAYQSIQSSDLNFFFRRLKILMAVFISSGFVVAWSPYVVLSFWRMFHTKDSLAPIVSMLPCLFAKGSTAYNPFIYYIFRRSFRSEVRQLKGIICCSAQPDSPSRGDTLEEGRQSVRSDVRQSLTDDKSGVSLVIRLGTAALDRPSEN
uniref:G-protein coupled receptors family 1 profile domain-containing protein n=1 Tax=Esox lucius TaxID=8010 RepID=A0AAY5KKS8_ESOLU